MIDVNTHSKQEKRKHCHLYNSKWHHWNENENYILFIWKITYTCTVWFLTLCQPLKKGEVEDLERKEKERSKSIKRFDVIINLEYIYHLKTNNIIAVDPCKYTFYARREKIKYTLFKLDKGERK